MTKQEKIQYIEAILESIHEIMYPHPANTKTGYNGNELSVFTNDIEEALDFIEMNNMECEYKENPFRPGYTYITIYIEKKEEVRPLWGYETA